MRDIITAIFENAPRDPVEAARRALRTPLRKRFYRQVEAGGAGEGGFPVLLDGKPVRTPLRRPLAAPTPALAQALAAEWNAQATEIDPARMPLTRLANAVIDAIDAIDAREAVAAEVAKYLGADLTCYRAEAPAGLVARQAEAWDPVLAWALEALGARFVTVQGVVHAGQPSEAIAVARAAIPTDPWRLGAVSSVTALTGSALLALALAAGARDAEAVWHAAHVDEDWQMQQWGRDEIALSRRAFRCTELQAAATVLTLV
jgi:chaperone required for assembly of F1-ATPase